MKKKKNNKETTKKPKTREVTTRVTENYESLEWSTDVRSAWTDLNIDQSFVTLKGNVHSCFQRKGVFKDSINRRNLGEMFKKIRGIKMVRKTWSPISEDNKK